MNKKNGFLAASTIIFPDREFSTIQGKCVQHLDLQYFPLTALWMPRESRTRSRLLGRTRHHPPPLLTTHLGPPTLWIPRESHKRSGFLGRTRHRNQHLPPRPPTPWIPRESRGRSGLLGRRRLGTLGRLIPPPPCEKPSS